VVTGRYVLANMGLRDERLYSATANPALAMARMVCLDRLTGRPVWARMPSELDTTQLGDPALRADLAECQFVGTPLVVGNAVWTLARTDPMRGRNFEQSFLVSLHLDTGETRSVTYLASSAGAEPSARWGQRVIMPQPASIMAYADGLIYAPTDTGALAAVRASDGGVEWLNLYPRADTDPIRQGLGAGRLRMRSRTESQPFHAAPVVVEAGRLFFKPPDAPHVFIWNAADGNEVARVDLSISERVGRTERLRTVDGNTTLLKVLGDRILTFGPQGVSCIDWAAVRDGKNALEATRWSSRIESANGEDSVMGRPAVTQTQLLLPTREHLRVIQLEDGRFVATYPTGGAEWAQNEGPGNVVALQDQLVIAGPERLNIYADSAVIRERLEKQVAQNPADPTPLLRLAQIAFVTGDFDTTEERLRQAEAAGDAGTQPEAGRAAVFASSLNFAQTLAERLGNTLAPGSPTAATVDRFFTLAEKFARTPAQNVRVRFARADFADTEGGAARRVALLQEILSDPAWRQVPTLADARKTEAAAGGEASSPRQAGEVARELLAQLIERAGPQVYEQIEQRAGEELAEATAAGDVELLLRLSEIYPNSAASASALEEAARLLQEQKRLPEAATALRRLAARSDNPVAAWMRLAQIEATRPGRLDVAAGRMRRAARADPEADAPSIPLPGGETLEGLTAEEAAFKLTEAALAAEKAAVVDLNLPDDPMKPLFAEEPASIAGVEALVIPVEGFERRDRLIIRRSDGTLALLAFGATEPVWSKPVDAKGADAAAWLADGLLLWGPGSVALLDAETGEAKWRHSADSLAPGLGGGGFAEGAVVASGWQPRAMEPANPEAFAEQQLRELELARRGGGGQLILRREQLRLNNQMRQEAIAQIRREGEPAEQAAAELDDREQQVIAAVVPSGAMITAVVGGAGRGAAGIAPDGEVRWRAPLPEGDFSAAHVDGDYAAIQMVGSRSVLSVLDLDDGTLITRRSFERDGAGRLANFLVTPENELVYSTLQQVIGVDLEKDPQNARFTVKAEPALGENESAFGVSAGEGRMKVIGGRLLVLADPTQSGRRDALVIDLAKGAVETYADPATGDRHPLLLTAAESLEDNISLDELPPRMRDQQRQRRQQARRDAIRAMSEAGLPGERLWTAGSSVYITADRGLSAYDLSLPGRHWKRLNAPMMREFDPAANLAVVIGRDDLLLFDQPQSTPRRQVEQPTLRLTVFSRDRLEDGRESGQQRHEVELAPGRHGLDAPVGAFQAMDGGLAVLSESGRLIFLAGSE
jgi:outer membrane protein assembly factor BamB